MTSTIDFTQALAVAKKAAETGAAIAVQKRAGTDALAVQAKGTADWVTDVDHAAQAAIISIIQAAFSDHRFLAEEEGADAIGDPHSPFRWIIDPLDGTINYIHGKKDYGTIVALQENGQTVLGAIVLPERQESYWGIRGSGAFFNGQPINNLRATKGLTEAILCTNVTKSRLQDGKIVLHAPLCGSVHNYGCAALELCEILTGHNDGLFYYGPKLWDTAAGCLLIEEAGGRTRTELIDPKDPRGGVRCVASTAPIFDELCAFVFKH